MLLFVRDRAQKSASPSNPFLLVSTRRFVYPYFPFRVSISRLAHVFKVI